jgi:hypothetical protein
MDYAMEKKVLNIDMDDLCQAMDDSSYEHDYYLDLETGDILFVSENMDDGESGKLKDQIEEGSDRYELVPKADSNEGYGDMEDFIYTVEDEHLAELLMVAINGRGAFRRFKDVLLNYPEARDRWFSFKDKRVQQRALEWLDDIGIALAEE